MPVHKSIFGALFAGANHHHHAHHHNRTEFAPSMLDENHHHTQKQALYVPEMYSQNFTHYEHKNSWHFPNPFADFKQYAEWGKIKFKDVNGTLIDPHEQLIKSTETNQMFKWYEEKTARYIAYEAAAKKFMLEEDYKNKGKCPIMSLLTTESQVDAKMNELAPKESPFYVEAPEESSGVPTAMFHGFGDFCLQPGDIQFNSMLSSGTGAPVKCIEVGVPMVGSIINNFQEIAEKSCQKIANDKTFAGEFNVIGLSQGGLLARYIAEECDMPGKVRNVVTLGGPHMGVAAVPHCFSGVMCDIVNTVAKKFVYTSWAQNWIAPAGYFRDVNDMITYEKDSVFLPALNNEHTTSEYAALRKSTFGGINAGLFGMFSEDTMIYPKETAWFQGLDKDGKVMKLQDMTFYKDDYIGLKALNEAGKITFSEIKGDHLEFTTEYIKETVIPFLKK